MSKILFITQKLTANSLNQIEIIRRSGHEFTVVTSQSEKNAGLKHPDVMYYFSRWNFIEMAKFLPSFMIINPDIVHVFVDSKSSMKTADFFSSLAQLFRKIFSVQFFLSEDSFLKMKRAKRLVYSADIVTGPHRTFLYHLRGLSARNRYQIKGVIPPILKMTHARTETIHLETKSKTADEFKSYQFLVPLKKKQFDMSLLSQLSQKFSLLLVADLSEWTASEIKQINHSLASQNAKPWRFFNLGKTQEFSSLPQLDLPLWIAGLEFELEECIQYFEFCLNRKVKIVMDHTQMRLYPDLWDSSPLATITQKHSLSSFISNFEYTNEPVDWNEHLNSVSLVDISVNEFNRLISKATNTQNEKAV